MGVRALTASALRLARVAFDLEVTLAGRRLLTAATATLIGEFMDGLRRGLPTDEALTLTKRLVRKSAGEANWVPFMPLGR